MKICANCQRKYADSLEYCLADGTVLSPVDDPQATLRFEARPTHGGAPAQRRVPVGIFAFAAIVLVIVVCVVAFVVLYYNLSKKTSTESDRPTSPAITTTNTGQTNNNSGKDEVAKKLEQIDADVASASLQSDVAALDRLLADDYWYKNSRGLSYSKQQTLVAYRRGFVRIESLTTSDRKVEVSSDLSRGVVNGRSSSRVWFFGRIYNDIDYSYTNTYEMRQGRWLLVNCQVWYRS